MKVFALTLLVLLTVGLVLQAAPTLSPDKNHEIKAQFVSADNEKHTITYKAEGADENTTAPVMGKASEGLKDLKPGDNVILVCQDDDNGEHQGIIEIKPVKSPSDK